MNSPWLNANSLSVEQWRCYRQRVIFDCDKWDPQVEDTSTVAMTPLVLDAAEWARVAQFATSLARETAAAENELLQRPELHDQLGIPRAVRNAMRPSQWFTESRFPRVIRFDFHSTDDGWQISEANTDVPGGFIESSGMTQLMATHFPTLAHTGDPADELARAVASRVGDGVVALVHASAYSDDRQVMIYLGRRLRSRGVSSRLMSPDQLRWVNGRAFAIGEKSNEPIALAVRFYPAEWLPNLPRAARWEHFFSGSRIPICNPGTSLLTQSKRLPLVWRELRTPLTTWTQLLPETHDPRDVDWHGADEWILKPALGRVGDGIGIAGVTDDATWRRIRREVDRHPSQWVAQRRFRVRPVIVNGNREYPCLGVFTIGERVVGAYGRLCARPLTDFRAADTAVLVSGGPVEQRPASTHGS